MSRKLALLSGGFLLVLGASGAAALMFAPAGLIPGFEDDPGGHCKTLYKSEYQLDQEKRLIAIIATSDREPMKRVQLGIRIARHLVKTAKPDLVIVHVADDRGPTARTELRGHAIGAEVVHAPHPGKTMATSKPWEARYVDALPTASGHYFGKRSDLRLTELEALNLEITEVKGCDGDPGAEGAETASASGSDGEPESASHEAPSGH